MKLFILSGRIFFCILSRKTFRTCFYLNWNDIFCIHIRKDFLFHHPERYFLHLYGKTFCLILSGKLFCCTLSGKSFFASIWEDISCILYRHKISCIYTDRLFVSSHPERYFVAFCLERCFCILSGKTFVASIVASISRNTFCSIFSGKSCYFKNILLHHV